MAYQHLRKMSKQHLIKKLIPLIEDAVMVNESWIDGRDGVHPTRPEFDAFGIERFWAQLRDLHDDYWD